MRTVDRQGIHIDQCEACRGIFLDRGELEQIVSAEQRHYEAEPIPPYQPDERAGAYQAPPQRQPWAGGYRDSPSGYRDSPPGYGGGTHPRKKKRRSFLEELFD